MSREEILFTVRDLTRGWEGNTMDRRRQPPGSSDGGRYAPETSGATNIPTPNDISTTDTTQSPEIALETSIQQVNRMYNYLQENRQAEPDIARCECGRFIDRESVGNCRHNRYFYANSHDEPAWVEETIPVYEFDEELGRLVSRNQAFILPSREELLRNLYAGGEATVEATLSNREDLLIWGRFVLTRNPEDDTIHINSDTVYCSCDTYRRNNYYCKHVALGERALYTRTMPLGQVGTFRDREAAWMKAEETRRLEAGEPSGNNWIKEAIDEAEAGHTWRKDSDGIYSVDPTMFIQDMRAERARAKAYRNQPALPFTTDDVLDGACKRGSGQAFGIELEYDFPPEWSLSQMDEARRRIGAQLKDFGLTKYSTQSGYHASQQEGYRDTQKDAQGHGTWSHEMDGSVAGEIVSPGLYDEPDTWTNIKSILLILKSNGAVPSVRTGFHIHVGTDNYNGSPAAYTELARLVNQHEDVMYRLAASPQRGTHRNNGYAEPLPAVPPQGFTSVKGARHLQHGRSSIINLLNCMGARGDHVEFRLFDGTLDAGTIQAQVKMAVGVTNAALRTAEQGGTSRGKEPLGTHYKKTPNATNPSSLKELVDDSWTMMSFLDTVFRRREDKAHLTAVAAHTQWVPNNG